MKPFLGIPLFLLLLSSCRPDAPADLLSEVDPFIGTGGHGHTFPGATAPFGMVQLSPDTRLTGWDGCSGYHYTDPMVYGFSHTHLSGTGIPDYADVLLMPTTGEARIHNGADGQPGYRSAFSKERETAEPGYYSTFLEDYNIQVELTASERVGYHRYRFAEGGQVNVILDLEHRDETPRAFLRRVGDDELEGYRISRAWAQEQHLYFVARFSKPIAGLRLFRDGAEVDGATSLEDERIKAALRFELDSEAELQVKVGISAVSMEGARRNLDADPPGWAFDSIRRATQDKWRKMLSKVELTGGTKAERRTFYTALYHTFLAPNLFTDVDGQYRGTDLKVHRAEGYEQYTVFSLWDTYRATHPLYTILQEERTVDFIRSMLAHYRDGGQLPMWELAGNYTGCMIGYHAVPVIADAYLKGIFGYDSLLALEAMKQAATQSRLGIPAYRQYGYIPAEAEAESVSKTLEYAYDDWCIAQMAKALGRSDDYLTYLRRAQYYKNLFDPSTGFFRARMNQQWVEPFDPSEVNFHFTEANAWQYAFYAPQDVEGLIALHGGAKGLEAKLDGLFSASSATSGREQPDITGLIGQYAHGNEPSHHIAYLYNYVHRPDKTQERVRQILDELYADAPDGLSGNEDCGQMSAWYVLSALGFYPVTPGSDLYAIGSPLFPEATLHLENGNSFRIVANGASATHKYIHSARLNGADYRYTYLRHADLMAGGVLELEMAATPGAWGMQPGDEPLSRIDEAPIVCTPVIQQADPAFYDSTIVVLTNLTEGARIYYTLDGSVPDTNSLLCRQALVLRESAELRAFAFHPEWGSSPVISASYFRIPERREIELSTEYAPQYAAGGDGALIDFRRGGSDFRTGQWQGYEGVDLDAVVDLGASKPLQRLALGCLQDENAWIFMPLRVRFYASDDGQEFRELGVVENEISPRQHGAVIRDFQLPVNTTARYLRVKAENRGLCPDFHKGAGGKAWIFVDEIVLE